VPRRLRQVPLSDRIFARALAYGATSEHPTEPAVKDLWRLADGNRDALRRALVRIDHPSGHAGHPGAVARSLLRSAMDHQHAPGPTELEESASG
jgi:hypothetical protein